MITTFSLGIKCEHGVTSRELWLTITGNFTGNFVLRCLRNSSALNCRRTPLDVELLTGVQNRTECNFDFFTREELPLPDSQQLDLLYYFPKNG